jgi:hypothetical protein
MSDSTDDVRLRTPGALPGTGDTVCGLPRFHHRVLTLSVDVRRTLDVLGASLRVHLDTDLFVTLLWRVLRAFVRRIRANFLVCIKYDSEWSGNVFDFQNF